jgi:putative DNA primase/helicase
MTRENIVRLAELQEDGELPPAAEDAIALAFAERHDHELRYVAAWGRWLCFDGTRWQHDDTLHTFDRARAICREVALDSEKSARALASAKTVAAVERLAKADRRLAATAAQWDSDGWLLNDGDDCGDH